MKNRPRILSVDHLDASVHIRYPRAVRDGRAVSRTAKRFKVMVTPGKPHFAATCLANAIAWRKGGGRVAILTPSRRQGFADGVVDLVGSGSLGKHQNGPFLVQWESSDEQEGKSLWQKLEIPDVCPVADPGTGIHRRPAGHHTLWLLPRPSKNYDSESCASSTRTRGWDIAIHVLTDSLESRRRLA